MASSSVRRPCGPLCPSALAQALAAAVGIALGASAALDAAHRLAAAVRWPPPARCVVLGWLLFLTPALVLLAAPRWLARCASRGRSTPDATARFAA